MSVKRGLIGFGMSASVFAGGAVAIGKWSDESTKIHEAKNCALEVNAGKLACQNIIAEPAGGSSSEDSAHAYGAIGLFGVIGGGIGAAISFLEALDFEYPAEIKRQAPAEQNAS